MPPGVEGGGDVDAELGGGQQLVALAVGLHQPVLDAVVHHLGEVTGADRAGVDQPAFGGERLQHRPDPLNVLVGAADHEAVAVLQPPHATRHAGVDEADTLGGQLLRAGDRVPVVGVPPVDDEVAAREEFTQFGDGGPRRFTGRHHDPRHPGDRERFGQLGQRLHVGDVGVAVVAHDFVAGAAQPLRHVPAHPAQTHHPDLHGAHLTVRSVPSRDGPD